MKMNYNHDKNNNDGFYDSESNEVLFDYSSKSSHGGNSEIPKKKNRKRLGRHPIKELTDRDIRNLKDTGRYPDGNGLYLMVEPTGSKHWILRKSIDGKRHDIGLGSYPTVGLATARNITLEYVTKVNNGENVLKNKLQKKIPNFFEAAEKVYQTNKTNWKNNKHKDQWIYTLRRYAFPHIGSLRIDQISTPHVLKLLEPIWLSKPETARRVRQRIGKIIDWGRSAGFCSGENPIRAVIQGLPKHRRSNNHHAALEYVEAPAFIKKLKESRLRPSTKLAFEFLILTATRSIEVMHLQWSEIDNEIWTIPAARTKSNREFRIPLSSRCLQILKEARILSNGSSYVFAGEKRNRPISSMTFTMALRRMGYGKKITAHGFRSTFTDWTSEETNFSSDVREMALNHSLKDKTEAAYRRKDLFQKRKDLMIEWENFICGP